LKPTVNSSTIQHFYFPGLFRAWKIKEKTEDFLGGVETLIAGNRRKAKTKKCTA